MDKQTLQLMPLLMMTTVFAVEKLKLTNKFKETCESYKSDPFSSRKYNIKEYRLHKTKYDARSKTCFVWYFDFGLGFDEAKARALCEELPQHLEDHDENPQVMQVDNTEHAVQIYRWFYRNAIKNLRTEIAKGREAINKPTYRFANCNSRPYDETKSPEDRWRPCDIYQWYRISTDPNELLQRNYVAVMDLLGEKLPTKNSDYRTLRPLIDVYVRDDKSSGNKCLMIRNCDDIDKVYVVRIIPCEKIVKTTLICQVKVKPGCVPFEPDEQHNLQPLDANSLSQTAEGTELHVRCRAGTQIATTSDTDGTADNSGEQTIKCENGEWSFEPCSIGDNNYLTFKVLTWDVGVRQLQTFNRKRLYCVFVAEQIAKLGLDTTESVREEMHNKSINVALLQNYWVPVESSPPDFPDQHLDVHGWVGIFASKKADDEHEVLFELGEIQYPPESTFLQTTYPSNKPAAIGIGLTLRSEAGTKAKIMLVSLTITEDYYGSDIICNEDLWPEWCERNVAVDSGHSTLRFINFKDKCGTKARFGAGDRETFLKKVFEKVEHYTQSTAYDLVLIGGKFNEPSHLDWKPTNGPNECQPFKFYYDWKLSLKMYTEGYTDVWRRFYPNADTHPGYTLLRNCKWICKPEERFDFMYYKKTSELNARLLDVKLTDQRDHFGDDETAKGIIATNVISRFELRPSEQ